MGSRQQKPLSQTDGVEWFDVGVVIGAHGIRGELVVQALSDVPDRLKHLKTAYLCDASHGQSCAVQLTSRPHAGRWLVKVSGIDDRTAAETYKGWYLAITRQQAGPLPAGRFFVRDLIGMTVVDVETGVVGTLKDVLTDRVQDLYQVARPGLPDLYFPAVPAFLLEISPEDQAIRVRLPEGLDDVYAP